VTDAPSGEPSPGTSRSEAFLRGVQTHPASFEGLRRQKRQNEVDLHRRVGNGALALMVGQLLIADTAFYLYGFKNGWHIPTAAITSWLAATVIQIVGVVLVIAKNLFPSFTPASES
jgi:hypothetical protein